MILRAAVVALGLLAAAPAVAAGPYGGTVRALLLDGQAAAPAWAATARGLFRYGDGHWARIAGLGQRDLVAVAEGAGRLLVAGADGSIAASEDHGATWQPSATGLRGRYGHPPRGIFVLVPDPADPARVFAGSAGQGVFRSADAGRTWELLLGGLEDEAPPALHAAALLPARRQRPLLQGTAGRGLFAWSGGRWAPLGEGLPANLRVQCLVEDPADPQHLALGTRGEGLWESRDAGATWKRLRKGLFGVVGAAAIDARGAVLAHFPEEGLVLARDGKARRPRELKRDRVNALVPLAGGGWLAALDDDGVLALGADGAPGAFRTAGLDATRVTALAAGPAAGELWAGDRNGAFFSADAGRSWAPRQQGLDPAPVTALLWHRGELLAGTLGAGVFRWDPAGERWEGRSGGLGTSNSIFSFGRDSADRYLYVATEGGILRSADAGRSWTRQNAGLPPSGTWRLAASPTRPGRVWAAGAGKLFRSDDAAETWSAAGAAADAAALAAGPLDGREVLWLAGHRELRAVGGDDARRLPLALADDERLEAVVPGPSGVWVGSSRGLWSGPAGALSRLWDGAGVLAVLGAADGAVWAGTDGRGVVRFRLR